MQWIVSIQHILLRRVRVFTHPLLARAFHRWCVITALALLGAAWVAALAVPWLPGEAPLIVHYTTTFGVDGLGGWNDFARLPLTGTVLVVVNLTLASFLTARKEPMPSAASSALIVTSALLAFAVLVGTVLLWRMNTTVV